MKNANIIIVAGRPASGKTETLIKLANLHAKKSLYICLEMGKEELYRRGLSKDIAVVEKMEDVFNAIDQYTPDYILLDYIELVGTDELCDDFAERLSGSCKQLYIAGQIRRNSFTIASDRIKCFYPKKAS